MRPLLRGRLGYLLLLTWGTGAAQHRGLLPTLGYDRLLYREAAVPWVVSALAPIEAAESCIPLGGVAGPFMGLGWGVRGQSWGGRHAWYCVLKCTEQVSANILPRNRTGPEWSICATLVPTPDEHLWPRAMMLNGGKWKVGVSWGEAWCYAM